MFKAAKKAITPEFFAENTMSAKKIMLSILVIASLAFLTLALPSTSIRLGEVNKTLYKLVIEYTEARRVQADLANMPSVLAGTLYQIDVKDGNTIIAHNFKPIDRAVEIYDVTAPLSPQISLNSVRAVLLAKPDLLQMTYQASDTKVTFIIDQTPIRNIVRGYMPMIFATVVTLLSTLGIILYFVLRRFYVAPLNTLTSTLTAFANDPTTARPTSKALHINKEFRAAAKALDDMQRNTISEMRQRDRLADIGEAVAKINHDIRNVLSSATLVADALLHSQDKQVSRTAPHVVRSLEQAVDLCQSMMDYLVAVPDPQLSTFSMHDIANELADATKMQITYSGPAKIHADRKMMQRIFLNLARNSANGGATKLHIDIWRAGHLGIIDISDNGHGIPKQRWDGLFQAFKSHGRGGTGLGLAITQDLVAAQAGM
ncbi:two-component hybrid sensor and regulator [Candidatus Puniceispirillum marinum IMCC1322]|uniref:histidine kinase n=2 Tax=Candidatus Puniceispirillum TaxID=767891 RepID=D5BU00_PUNMI|nr:two-component hybrid sensor and regulator [Candidatus Puniceispirillum marinum IMCC1322]